MEFYFNVMLFILFFQKIKPFLIISMTKKNIDDCIRKIELDDGNNLFEKNTSVALFQKAMFIMNP